MKKLCLILVICLLLCACGTDAPEKTELPSPTTETKAPLRVLPPESGAWADFAEYSDKLGVVLNEPVENPPTATTFWIEGEEDGAYIVPRFAESYVNLYRLVWSEDYASYSLADEPEFSTLAGDGCVIYTVLPRPEGIPVWYLEIVGPDGVGDGYVIEYNGKDGTAPIEFFEYRP